MAVSADLTATVVIAFITASSSDAFLTLTQTASHVNMMFHTVPASKLICQARGLFLERTCSLRVKFTGESATQDEPTIAI